MSSIVIQIEKTTGTVVTVPLQIPRGGIRALQLNFLNSGTPELFDEGTLIVFEVFAPGDLVTPIAPGGTLNLWARNATAKHYTASIDMGGPVLAAINLTTLFGRIRYTEPAQSEVVIDDFHIVPLFDPLPGNQIDTFLWEQIENPPDVSAYVSRLPANSNFRINESNHLQIYDTGADEWRTVWFNNGNLEYGETEA